MSRKQIIIAKPTASIIWRVTFCFYLICAIGDWNLLFFPWVLDAAGCIIVIKYHTRYLALTHCLTNLECYINEKMFSSLKCGLQYLKEWSILMVMALVALFCRINIFVKFSLEVPPHIEEGRWDPQSATGYQCRAFTSQHNSPFGLLHNLQKTALLRGNVKIFISVVVFIIHVVWLSSRSQCWAQNPNNRWEHLRWTYLTKLIAACYKRWKQSLT